MLIATGVTRHMILAGDPDLEEVGKADRCRSVLRNAGTPVAEVTALARLCPEPDGRKHVSLLVGDKRQRHGTRAQAQEVTKSALVWRYAVPGGASWRVNTPDDFPINELYVTSPPFECALRARDLSVPELALLMTVQCGTFRCSAADEDARDGMLYGTGAWTTIKELNDFLELAKGRWHGCRRYARALDYALEGCASIPEAKTAIMLSVPRRLGGMGLGTPRVNEDVAIPGDILPLMEVRKSFRYDGEWGVNVDVEYNGWPHNDPDAMLDDMEKILASVGMGRIVLPVTRRTWESFERFEVFANILAAQSRERPLPEPTSEMRAAQRALFEAFRDWDPLC